MAVESIAKTLGTGSGIDTTALVSQLVDAQFSVRNQSLQDQSDALTAQISGISQLKSSIASFATALKSLVGSGTLQTQPVSSNTAVLNVTGKAGADLKGLNASVEVKQLAAGQTAATGIVGDSGTAVGKGTLTLTFGTATVSSGQMTDFTAGSGTPVDITIDDSNSSLDGIAQAINAANAGVTATVLTDADGSRLVVKGPTGADKAFTLTATEDPTAPGLSALDIGPGASNTTVGTAAQDAIVAVDGVSLKRSSNSIDDLISGVQMDLVDAKPGTIVKLSTVPPTDALRAAVNDYVDTYNTMLSIVQQQTDPKTGPLANDTSARSLATQLSQLTLTKVVSGANAGEPTTLAEIGVATNRDGTLTVDDTRLDNALNTYPDIIEKMFKPGTAATGDGLSGALSSLSDEVTSTTYGLGASLARYTSQQSDLTDEQAQAASDADTMRTRLTQQFATMDAKVAAYKSTQTFLQQQVDAWNGKSS